MVVANQVNLILEVHKLLKLSLEVLKLRVLMVESLKALINLLLPEPVVALEAIEELLNVVLGSLD
jgi:hypothetical protein